MDAALLARDHEPMTTVPKPLPLRSGRQSDEAAAQTKERIISAALKEFAQHGFEGASLRNIAKQAGTTHGLIRHHFGSKDDVFRAVVDASVNAYKLSNLPVFEIIQRGEHVGDPVSICKQSLSNFAHVSASNPDMMRLLMHEGSYPSKRLTYLYERIEQMDVFYDELFEKAKAAGALKNFDCDSYFLYMLCNLGLPFGLAAVSSRYTGGNILDETQVEAQLERILNTLFPE